LRLHNALSAGNHAAAQLRLRENYRRQLRLGAISALITLLLTLAAASIALTGPNFEGNIFYFFSMRQAVYGLIGLVLLFDLFIIYRQVQNRHVQLELSEQHELLHLIGQHAADMIAVVDTKGRRLYNSPSYQTVLGYSAEELADANSFEQIHPDDRQFVIAAAEEAKRSGSTRKLEYRFRHKDGTWKILESTASLIRNTKGEPDRLVIINRDVTSHRETEKTLRETQLRHSHKMEALGRLSGGISHDFNNLLSVIIGYAEILDDYASKNEGLRKSLGEIKKAAHRGASLTRQLLAYSRQQVLAPSVMDLNEIVRDMEKMLRRLIGEDIELTTALSAKLGRVMADRGQIEQVIMNLAANARDAMVRGGKLTITTENRVLDGSALYRGESVNPGPYVMLSVSDTGSGMDAETQKHIFEPFFTTKELGRGTGLGLATVFGIVEQCNGHIWVYSEVGKGTTFKLYLPEVGSSVQNTVPEPSRTNSRRTGETILVVEDDESLRVVTRDLLVQGGYEVLEASNGVLALEMAQRQQRPIHLLLTDVVMPEMSGPVLAGKLGAAHPETTILYMSGYTDQTMGDHGILEPGVLFLEKPYTRDTLNHKVREALDRAKVTA
jgi:two-component system, cell cycle sensor histidine kinase and response regulator CckA